MRGRIPVIVVAGFLGSGKTTLLNHLLRNNRGTRIGVVVNDFGSINIDSMLVASQVDSMVSLGNGCICCEVNSAGMDTLFARLTRPQPALDVIVVEASGIAEPRSLVRMVTGSSNRRINYGGLVQVVDAAEFPVVRVTHPELDGHLRLADLVVLNKADRVDAEALSQLTKELGELAAPAPVYPATRARVDPAMLFDIPDRPRPAVRQLTLDELLYADDDHSAHTHSQFDSASFSSADPVDPRALMAFLSDPPAGTFRVKGVVCFAVARERRKFVLQLVGRHVSFIAQPWAEGESRTTSIVLVGAGLDAGAALTRLRETVHTGEPLGPDTMLGVRSYLDR